MASKKYTTRSKKPKPKGFSFGEGSEEALIGVHPKLIAVERRAIEITTQDFTVLEGVRDRETQKKYVRSGASTTMNSKHLIQSSSFGHAVDNVPWIGGRARWEIIPCSKIAIAVRQAAEELDTLIRWGGCWRVLNGTTEDPMDMVQAYIDRKSRQGRRPFVDGPHFELYGV